MSTVSLSLPHLLLKMRIAQALKQSIYGCHLLRLNEFCMVLYHFFEAQSSCLCLFASRVGLCLYDPFSCVSFAQS